MILTELDGAHRPEGGYQNGSRLIAGARHTELAQIARSPTDGGARLPDAATVTVAGRHRDELVTVSRITNQIAARVAVAAVVLVVGAIDFAVEVRVAVEVAAQATVHDACAAIAGSALDLSGDLAARARCRVLVISLVAVAVVVDAVAKLLRSRVNVRVVVVAIVVVLLVAIGGLGRAGVYGFSWIPVAIPIRILVVRVLKIVGILDAVDDLVAVVVVAVTFLVPLWMNVRIAVVAVVVEVRRTVIAAGLVTSLLNRAGNTV